MKKIIREKYKKPTVEMVGMPVSKLLTPVSWDPDFVPGESVSMNIIEGDPDGDGKGANNNNSFEDEEDDVIYGNVDMWDTI